MNELQKREVVGWMKKWVVDECMTKTYGYHNNLLL